MQTLEFLGRILPSRGVYFLATFKNRDYPNHDTFTSLEDLANAALNYSAAGYSTYHACSSFIDSSSRKSPNALAAKSFWVDIDCSEEKFAKGKGYKNRDQATEALRIFCETSGLPAPTIVSSGYGIHCYWVLTRDIPSKTWQVVAQYLKALTHKLGLICDPSRTADASSVLRPVGTLNSKDPNDKRLVECIYEGDPIEPEEFFRIIKHQVPSIEIREKPIEVKLNSDLIQVNEYPPSSADLVANECAQLREMRNLQGNISYEHWRNCIGVLKFCIDGEEKAHEWSTGHPTYTAEETDKKLAGWEMGPTTCAKFKENNPVGCASCKYMDKGVPTYTSPIILGRVLPQEKIVIEEEVDSDGVVNTNVTPEFPQGFSWTEHGLTTMYKGSDKKAATPITFCTTLFFPYKRMRMSDGTMDIRFKKLNKYRKFEEFTLPAWVIGSSSDLQKKLAAQEIYSTSFKDANTMLTAYVKAYADKLKTEVEAIETYDTFGWKNGENLLLGNRLYCSNGEVREVYLTSNAKAVGGAFDIKGSVEEYSKAVNGMYARNGKEPLQYVFGNAFGCILTELADAQYKGLLLAITGGTTAKGKTTAAEIGISAFANPEALTVSGVKGATTNARYGLMSTLKNVPMLMDELTNIKANHLSDLAFFVSMGMEKRRMVSGNYNGTISQAPTHTWRMSPIATANSDLQSILASDQSNSQAEAVRILQIKIDEYPNVLIETLEANAYRKTIGENTGAAGDLFARYVVKNADSIRKGIETVVEQLTEYEPNPKYRFYRYNMACTLVAIKITNALGITMFDEKKLFAFTKSLFAKEVEVIKENNTLELSGAINKLISELSPQIAVSEDYRDCRNGVLPEDIRLPTGKILGRHVLATGNAPAHMKNKLYLIKGEVSRWCNANRTDAKELYKWGEEHGLLEVMDKKFSLVKGLKISGGSQSCICIDMAKLEELDE